MDSEITSFYKNLNVLITGGTGLLGQLIIEKLLRVCSNVEGIYVILREKKGLSANERLTAVFEDRLYDQVRKTNKDLFKKVHALQGDLSLPKLGIDHLDRQVLIDKIHVVFHCAAVINMEAKVVDAVTTNVGSLHEVLDLCREMKNLKSMLFVSTAYSNCIHSVIEEKFYPPPIDPCTIMKMCKETEGANLESRKKTLLDRWPNTYCYSKAIAEDLLRQNSSDLPVALFRPSVLVSTYLEPVTGWISNLHGATGFFLACGLGVSRVIHGNPNIALNIVPADLCTNAMICAAWKTHVKFKTEDRVLVYNYADGVDHTIPFQLMFKYAECNIYPLKNAIYPTSQIFVISYVKYYILRILLHYIPGALIDCYLFLCRRRKTRMIEAYRRLSKVMRTLKYFTLNEWDIKNKNVCDLWSELNETDKKLFSFDMNAVDHKHLLRQCAIGIKSYVLKEPLDNEANMKNGYMSQWVFKIHRIAKPLLHISVMILMYSFFRMVIFD